MLLVLTGYTEVFALLFLRVQIGLSVILVHYIKEENHLFNFQFPDFFPLPECNRFFIEEIMIIQHKWKLKCQNGIFC